MPFNPTAPFAFNFQQGQSSFPQAIEYTDPELNFNSISELQLFSLPQWLVYENLYLDTVNSKILFTLKLNENYTNTLEEGDYSDACSLKFKKSPILGNVTKIFIVTLNVQETVFLNVTPSNLSFPYIVGDPLPPSQTIQIQSGSNWSILSNVSWITLSPANGFQGGSSSIGVDTVGLSVGTYSAILEVSDSQFTKLVSVTLTITQGNNEVDFLFVTPNNLQFVSEFEVPNNTTKSITLEASNVWTAVVSDPWLVLSSTSGNSGNNNLALGVDSALLPNTGVPYLGTITFNCQDIEKTIYIQLYIVNLLISGLNNDGFYYADDRNKLLVTNVSANNFLVLDSVAFNGITNTIFKLRAPYQNGLAKVLLGQEANNLLISAKASNTLSTGVNNKIKPLTVNYKALNKNRLTDSTVLIQQFQNVKFLKGKTPEIVNKLCYTPSVINLTPKGVLSLSVLSEEAPNQIVITGDHNLIFATSISNDLFVYNAILNLQDIPLTPGEQITVTFGEIQVVVNIQENEVESNIIAFENEWGEYELLEFKGFLSTVIDAEKLETELQVEGDKYSKIVSIDIGKEYTIDSGWIFSKEEIDWFLKILSSKRVFLYQNESPVEIVIDTKRLSQYTTKEFYKSFSLKFKKAII